ncbi:Protease inhibitor/seed storage/lipid transfer protein family protein [Quillaja saponaria]|uniref:Protease inhibitor/seed storage/lipid transfer protein family protein n=1 Tax=Quillaja saponaria TaxID=32244 RepID=A0AAD7PBE3_QUISA|nr:Protease inhibitor/seed storage/lipid transfer protein family protein [Quillaja saponaria]
MARLSINFMVLATFTITGILTFSVNSNVVLAQKCKGDIQDLKTQCSTYVQKGGPRTDPSQGCCNLIKTADIPCFCRRFGADMEKEVDMDKMVYVAEFCGKPLASGTKCGSFTVPPQYG